MVPDSLPVGEGNQRGNTFCVPSSMQNNALCPIEIECPMGSLNLLVAALKT